MCEIVVN